MKYNSVDVLLKVIKSAISVWCIAGYGCYILKEPPLLLMNVHTLVTLYIERTTIGAKAASKDLRNCYNTVLTTWTSCQIEYDLCL